MSTINSLKKRSRQLEIQGRWQDLSETYNKIAMALRNDKEYDQAIEYHMKERELCEKTQDPRANAHGNKYFWTNNFTNKSVHVSSHSYDRRGVCREGRVL